MVEVKSEKLWTLELKAYSWGLYLLYKLERSKMQKM